MARTARYGEGVTQSLLSPVGGEFIDHEREAAFQQERLPETLRHTRLLFLLSAVLNALFLVSDWRFFGQPHFFVAVPARLVVVALALACLWAIHRADSFPRAQRVMLSWEWGNAVAVSALVSSHSDIAFVVVFMLPAIYYLVVPTAFRWTLLSGAGCGAMMLAAYLLPEALPSSTPGLVLATVMLHAALVLVVTRSNRLRRLEWAAVNAERRAKEDLAVGQAMLERMFVAVPVPLVVTARADGRLIKANAAALTYFGGDPGLLGILTLQQLYVAPEQRRELLSALGREGRVEGFELQIRLADGSVRDVLAATTAIEVDGEPCLMSSAVDITERKALEAHLQRLANTDPLTGLANRTAFFSAAETEVRRAHRHGRPLAVLMADLDHFKRLNDAHGHEAGDRALVAFAGLCRDLLRQLDVVARFGGEEFAIFLPETEPHQALAVAERLRRRVEVLPEPITVSIGVSQLRAGETTLDVALARADQALYAAKRAGRNRVMSDAEA